MIDTHCHVMPEALAHDARELHGVLRRCDACGMPVIVVSLDCSTGTPEIPLETLRGVFAEHRVRLAVTLGFSPPIGTQGEDDTLEERLGFAIETMRALSGEPDVVGIGEVGLDYYWPTEDLRREHEDSPLLPGETQRLVAACHRVQQQVFARFIELAHSLDLPLVIHDREAHADTLALLAQSDIVPGKVLFHCFGGSAQDAIHALGKGYWISLPSSLVDRDRYRDIAVAVPLERVVMETDSPYHSPVVGLWKRAARAVREQAAGDDASRMRREIFARGLLPALANVVFEEKRGDTSLSVSPAEYFAKGKNRYRNEPAFVCLAVPTLAEIKGMSVDSVRETLTRNACTVFGIDV
jgi:TatD DNase family protein